MSEKLKERLEAFIRLAVPLVCLVAGWFSVELDADLIIQIVLGVLTAVSGVYAWWKDNNVSNLRVAAQGLVDAFKGGAKIVPVEEDDDDV